MIFLIIKNLIINLYMNPKFVAPSAVKYSKEELKESLPKGSYTETQPVTFYTEHIGRKTTI